MERYELLTKVREYCDNNGIVFIPGLDDAYQLRERFDALASDQLILTFYHQASVPFNQANGPQDITYNCVFALGRKYEAEGTESSLDETFEQKYDRRLKELSQLLEPMLTTIACENELLLGDMTMTYDLNKFDTNIDFVVTSIAITQ